MTYMHPTNQLRNQSVDMFRFFAALGVVLLHVQYPDVPKEIAIGIRLMSRWAIPFFFIVSGYFLAASRSKTIRLNVQPAVERLIWVFLFWSLVYAFVVTGQHGINTSIQRIFSPSFFNFGNFVHLWFLPSLIFGYLIIAFCYNFNLKGLPAILSLIAILSALLSGAYAGIGAGKSLDFNTARNWLSIPFLYIGFLLYEKGCPPWWVSLILTIFGAGLQVFEARFLYDKFGSSPYQHEFLIGTIPFGIGMAGLALSDLRFLKYSLFNHWGRNYSLGIYLSHPLIAIILLQMMGLFQPNLLTNPIWQLSFPFMVIAISLISLEFLHRHFPMGFNALLGKQANTPQSD
jgi:surface polysaccharide O-acyltransferase-like enzyme